MSAPPAEAQLSLIDFMVVLTTSPSTSSSCMMMTFLWVVVVEEALHKQEAQVQVLS